MFLVLLLCLPLASTNNALLLRNDSSSVDAAKDYVFVPPKEENLIEGDIILPDGVDRGAINFGLFPLRKWPGGVVPYVIQGIYFPWERSNLEAAIEDFNTLTCLQLVPRTNQINYIRILRLGGFHPRIRTGEFTLVTMVKVRCSSYIGRQPLWVIIGQPVFLGFGCLNTKGTAIHELLHAVGFFHEQSRPDRDAYVRIQWWNILPWNWSQFTKRWTINSLGSPYDYDSVMHYGNRAFSWNGFKTIVARDDPNRVLGQRDGFSESDIEQVNNLYGC